MHAFANGEKDEKTVSNILDRLDKAKADLNTRIITTHVGLSRTTREAFIATLPIIQRVDRNVQRVLGQRLAIATQLERIQSSQRCKVTFITFVKRDYS